MADERYELFLDSLIKKTKTKEIKWKYLDSCEKLYLGMNWVKETSNYSIIPHREEYEPDFNTEDSFYTSIDNTYIVIYVYKNKPANLYVIPNTLKKIMLITAENYGEYITRLLNLVQSGFPDAERFIDSFISGNNQK